jgi:hypothetical protein
LGFFPWFLPTKPCALRSIQPLKMSTRDFSWGKGGRFFGWRPATLVVPTVEKIRGLNLPGTPRATSVCRGIPLQLHLHYPSVPPLPHSVHPYTSTQPYSVTYFQSTESRIPVFLFSFASIYRSVHIMHFILYSFQFLVSTYISLRRLLHITTYYFSLPSVHPHSLLIHF